MKKITGQDAFSLKRLLAGLIIVVGGCLAQQVQAALTLIEKDGPTVNAQRYLKNIVWPSENSMAQVKRYQSLFQQKPMTISPATLLYPVQSDLTSGTVTTQSVHTPRLSRPLFVIGDDPLSIQWATYHADELKRIHALGLITNVNHAERVKAIEKQTDLSVIPVNITGMSEQLRVSHYPFLWTTQGVEQ